MTTQRTIAEYKKDIMQAARRVRRGKSRVVIPRLHDCFKRRPGAFFHPTPEFFIQTGGATDFVCPADTFRLNPGDICVMPTGVPHAESAHDTATPFGVLLICQYGKAFTLIRSLRSPKGGTVSEKVTHVPGPTPAFRLLEELAGHHSMDRPLRKAFVEGLLSAFFAAILTGINQPIRQEANRDKGLVQRLERIVRTELSHPELNVGYLAARLGCGPDHLNRVFRAESGSTLKAWITQERLRLAHELLTNRSMNVAEVGWACGFARPSYFIRVFRRHTRMTPGEWKLGQARLLHRPQGYSS